MGIGKEKAMTNLRLILMSLRKNKFRNSLIFMQFFITFIALIFSLGLLMDIYIKIDNARKVLPSKTLVLDNKAIFKLEDHSNTIKGNNNKPISDQFIVEAYKDNNTSAIAYYSSLDITNSDCSFILININRTLNKVFDFKAAKGRKLTNEDLNEGNGLIPVMVGENVAKVHKLNSTFKCPIGLKGCEFQVVGILDSNIKFWVTNQVFVENMKDSVVTMEKTFEDMYSSPTVFIPNGKAKDLTYCNSLISKCLKVDDSNNYFMSLDERLVNALKEKKENLFYLLSFSLILLVLSFSGVLSLVLLSISKRRREFGIRLSIGSYPRDIARFIVGEVALIIFTAFIFAFIVGYFISAIIPKDQGIVINGYVFALSLLINLLSIALLSIIPVRMISKYTPNNLIRGV